MDTSLQIEMEQVLRRMPASEVQWVTQVGFFSARWTELTEDVSAPVPNATLIGLKTAVLHVPRVEDLAESWHSPFQRYLGLCPVTPTVENGLENELPTEKQNEVLQLPQVMVLT